MRRPTAWVLLVAVWAVTCGQASPPPTSSPGTTASGGTTVPRATTLPGEITVPEVPTPLPLESPDTLLVGTTDQLTQLDPADAYSIHDWELIHATGEALLSLTPGTTELEPGIAEDWTVSDDGATYVFTLRDDVRFSDGTPLDAQLYVRQIDRAMRLEGSGGVGSALVEPFLERVEATGPHQVTFHLTGPFAYFPQVVTGSPYVPTHPDTFPGDSLAEFPDPPVHGVGPWFITDYTANEQTVLEPNPHYFGEREPKEDRVVISYYADAQILALALQDQEIDIAWRTISHPDLLERLRAMDGLNVGAVPGGGIRFLIINHEKVPPEAAEALAYLIDRDQIVERVFAGTAEPLYSQVPPGFSGATQAFRDVYEPPRPEQARALLERAGYTEDGPLQLQVAYPPEHYGGMTADSMQILEEQFELTGQIEVELLAQDWDSHVGACTAGHHQVCMLGWFFNHPDTSDYLEPFVYQGGLGTRITDEDDRPLDGRAAQLVSLLQQAATTIDQDQRAELYRQAQNLYAEMVVTLPLWLHPEHVAYWDHISGDPDLPTPETLNIGPTLRIHYELLSKGE